jgi:hypothetical protein
MIDFRVLARGDRSGFGAHGASRSAYLQSSRDIVRLLDIQVPLL